MLVSNRPTKAFRNPNHLGNCLLFRPQASYTTVDSSDHDASPKNTILPSIQKSHFESAIFQTNALFNANPVLQNSTILLLFKQAQVGCTVELSVSPLKVLLKAAGLNMKFLSISILLASLPPGVRGFATLTRPLLYALFESSSSVY